MCLTPGSVYNNERLSLDASQTISTSPPWRRSRKSSLLSRRYNPFQCLVCLGLSPNLMLRLLLVGPQVGGLLNLHGLIGVHPLCPARHLPISPLFLTGQAKRCWIAMLRSPPARSTPVWSSTDNVPKFGGHAARVTGASFLVAKGRWYSQAAPGISPPGGRLVQVALQNFGLGTSHAMCFADPYDDLAGLQCVHGGREGFGTHLHLLSREAVEVAFSRDPQ